MSDIFKKYFGFCKVETAHVDEFWNCLPLSHFEEAVEDEEEFLEIGWNRSATLHTVVTDFLTEFLADKHLLRNRCLPRNSELSV